MTVVICYLLIAGAFADKKLIRRWDSERELFTTTSYTYYKMKQTPA